MALWCVAFAVVSAVLEVTDHLADGPYADYTTGFTVMNWLVFALKILGVAVALLSAARSPTPVPPTAVSIAVWGAFATLAAYALGSVAHAFAMASGHAGNADDVDLAGVAYLLFFLLAAAGYGVLAMSYSLRHALGWRPAVLGLLCAPVVLGLVLLAVPTLLAAMGLLPAS